MTVKYVRLVCWIITIGCALAASFGHYILNPLQVGAACYIAYAIVCMNEKHPSAIDEIWGIRFAIVSAIALVAISGLIHQSFRAARLQNEMKSLCKHSYDALPTSELCDNVLSRFDDY